MKDDDYFDKDDFYFGDRKERKKEKKKKQSLDRSKFKKTDIEKKKSNMFNKNIQSMPKGRILSILGEKICVDYQNTHYFCTLRGALKKDKTLMKNLIAVGDWVRFSYEELSIYFVEDRTSILSREEPLRKKQHLIAVNIDQVLIVCSILSPPLKPALIDRYIIAAKLGHMVSVVVINKIDLLEKLSQKEKQLLDEAVQNYKKVGLDTILVSAKTSQNIAALKHVMQNKSSVFSGQSGVGKSSLINKVTALSLKTGEIVKKSNKGAHITSRAQLIPLDSGGFCIDTPGIKSFGLWQLEKSQIQNFFPEIAQEASKCKYSDCTHDNEPDCAVKKAVEEKRLSSLRFESYHSLMKDVKENK